MKRGVIPTSLLALLGYALQASAIGRIAIAMLRTPDLRVSAADPRVLYEPGMEELAMAVAQALPDAVAQVERAQHLTFAKPFVIRIFASPESFAKYSGARPGPAAVTVAGNVYVSPKLAQQEWRITPIITHELSHVQIVQHAGGLAFARLPPWFAEGLAVLVSDGGGAENASDAQAREHIRAGKRFEPEESGSFFRYHGADFYGLQQHVFYREAALFVAYLRQRDQNGFDALIQRIAAGERLASAFSESYGIGLKQAWSDFLTTVTQS